MYQSQLSSQYGGSFLISESKCIRLTMMTRLDNVATIAVEVFRIAGVEAVCDSKNELVVKYVYLYMIILFSAISMVLIMV
jgi:hypothetical protein